MQHRTARSDPGRLRLWAILRRRSYEGESMPDTDNSIALLIDADNAPAAKIEAS